MALLKTRGRSIVVLQLQGNLTFSSMEAAVHEVLEREATGLEFLILDFGHVLSINSCAARLVFELVCGLAAEGKSLAFTHPEKASLLGRVFRTKLGDGASDVFRTFEDNDSALEYCEDCLLERLGFVHSEGESAALAEFELLEGFSEEEISILSAGLGSRKFGKGEVIIEVGTEARELFLLKKGRVIVWVGTNGARKRLATFSSGMFFGEMALIDRSPRSATILADSAVECEMLTVEALDQLGVEHPGVKIKLLENLSRGLSRKLRKANVELSVFE